MLFNCNDCCVSFCALQTTISFNGNCKALVVKLTIPPVLKGNAFLKGVLSATLSEISVKYAAKTVFVDPTTLVFF